MTQPLTPLVLSHLNAMFPEPQRVEAHALLRDQCGDNLPATSEWERIRVAALKMSAGDLNALYSAIELAQTDWRDLLVAADFAEHSEAHLSWRPGPRDLPAN